jgi:hypothetical protein
LIEATSKRKNELLLSWCYTPAIASLAAFGLNNLHKDPISNATPVRCVGISPVGNR